MRKTICNHLQYTWWVYVVIAATAVFLWSFVFSNLAKPAQNERLNLSFLGAGFDHERLQADLSERLFKDSGIKEVFVDSAVPENNINDLLYVRSQGEFDAVIIPKSACFAGMADTYFSPLDRAQVLELLGNVSFYEENGQAYGIELSGACFAEYFSGEDICCLFISPVSRNFADISGGDEKDDAGIRAVKYLLGGAD